jgi:hypothetical protein
MGNWKDILRGDSIPWLLETDTSQPAVRYFTMHNIMDYPEDDKDVKKEKSAIMNTGPVPVILASQEQEGYWYKPGPGYSPKYKSTVWQIIFLSQLGADITDPRVSKGCEYVLNHSIAGHGGITYNGIPSGFIHCLSGNMLAALIDLGCMDDKRVQSALEWQARMITGDGVADNKRVNTQERYYAYTPGPNFACGPNGGLPCGWGAIKAMLALSKVPLTYRTERINKAIEKGVSFLLSYDVATGGYPFGFGNKPSSSWLKFGYPIGYVADVLQNLEVLVALGQGKSPEITKALEFVINKQDSNGRWKMEYSLNGKMWADIEKKGQPSKWITMRALRVLKTAFSGSK